MNAIQLRRMILGAAEHVPFYRRHWAQAGVDLTRIYSAVHLEFLPVVSKADLRACPPEERLDGRFVRQTMRTTPSSRPTQLAAEAPLDPYTLRRRRSRFLRALFDVGYSLGERVMLVVNPPHPAGAALLRWTYVNPQLGDDAVFEKFARVRPHVLHAPLRSLVLLARRMLATPQVTWRPRLLVSTGEQLTDANRALLESAFRAKVADFYSTRELGLLAYTKPWVPGYQLMKDEFHFELVPAGGGGREGLQRLVVTDLVAGAAPLIRFDTGDFVAAGASALAYASASAAACAPITSIGRREADCLELSDGSWLSPHEVALALERNATQRRHDVASRGDRVGADRTVAATAAR